MNKLPGMRVVAAAFLAPSDAVAAEAELRSQLDVGPSDIELGRVGGDPGREGFPALLVGRFREHRTQLVESIVRRYRGRVVEDLPEERVRRASPPGTS